MPCHVVRLYKLLGSEHPWTCAKVRLESAGQDHGAVGALMRLQQRKDYTRDGARGPVDGVQEGQVGRGPGRRGRRRHGRVLGGPSNPVLAAPSVRW